MGISLKVPNLSLNKIHIRVGYTVGSIRMLPETNKKIFKIGRGFAVIEGISESWGNKNWKNKNLWKKWKISKYIKKIQQKILNIENLKVWRQGKSTFPPYTV